MSQSEYSLFKRYPISSDALSTLSSGQRALFGILTFGSIAPLFFVGFLRPVLLPFSVQIACISALLYMRWRLPAFRGSLLAFLVAIVAFAVALAVLVAA